MGKWFRHAERRADPCLALCRSITRPVILGSSQHARRRSAQVCRCCALAQTTFRRLLLNKCQEEFEEGDAAIKAVDAREKAAAAAEAQNVHAPLKLCRFWKCWICCVHKKASVCGLSEVLTLGLLASTDTALGGRRA